MLQRIDSGTDLVECPYNKTHRILRSRLQVHLIRCRKSHPLAKLVSCPFNSSHLINEQDMSWHVASCPERKSLELFKHADMPLSGLTSTLHTTFCADSLREDQSVCAQSGPCDWDNDPDVPTYNPQNYVVQARVVRLPVGLQPAERSAFREAERKRLMALEKCEVQK